MTISSDLNKHIYEGNGATISFPFAFPLLEEEEMKIYYTDPDTGETTLLTSNYTVNPVNGQYPAEYGSVTYPSIGNPLPVGAKLTLLRKLDIVQETDYPSNSALRPKVVETSLDRACMIDQQQQEQIDRTLQLSIAVSNDVSRELPSPVSKQLLRWNEAATGLENSPPGEDYAAQAAESAQEAAESAEAAAERVAAVDALYDGTGVVKDIISKGPFVDVRSFYPSTQIGPDGNSHPLSEIFPSLLAAQDIYPHATDLSDEIDWCAIQAAVNYTKLLSGTVLLPIGTYVVNKTVVVTDGEFYGCRIEGINARGTNIVSSLAGTMPLFKFRGGSGAFSNVGLKNLSIEPETTDEGVAIYIDGQCFALFENVRIKNMKYGVWVHNQSAGTFSELNQFYHMQIEYCENNIRIEQGGGNNSFHGCSFDHIYMNIGANQIGFNMVSGYFYAGRFNLFMWSHDTTSVYVNSDGNTENCIGNISYESFEPGRITGTGRFWFNGFLRGIGGINDETTAKSNGEMVFACSNYQTPITLKNTSMKSYALTGAEQRYSGQFGMLKRLVGTNIDCLLGLCYSGSSVNGLYLANTASQQAEDNANIGMFLSVFGSRIKTYNASGMSIVTSDDVNAMTVANGRFTGNPGRHQVLAMSANAGVQQTVTFSLYTDPSIFSLVGIRITGSSFEYRKLYTANHQAFGADGILNELASGYMLSNSSVTVNAVSVNSSGQLQISITTSINLNITINAIGVGLF